MSTTRVCIKFLTTFIVGYFLLLGTLSGTLHLSVAALGFCSLWLVNRLKLI